MSGFLFSFAASVSAGTIAFIILQQGATRGFWPAFWYVIGDGLSELFIVGAISLGFIRLGRSPLWMHQLLRWAWVIFLFLSAFSFYAAFSIKNSGTSKFSGMDMPPFAMGMTVRFMVPTLIPYWAGISAWMVSEGRLNIGRPWIYFVSGVFGGAILAHLLYAIGGVWFKDWVEQYQSYLFLVMGVLFLGLAVRVFFNDNRRLTRFTQGPRS